METTAHFKPLLGLFGATMIVAGSMIGSGIFVVSADMVKDVGSAGWLIFAWVLTGFMTVTAALCYRELSGMFPKAGGQYVYLKAAYNPLMGFLYGWSFFAVIQTGTIAAVGVAFSKFAAYLIPALSEKNILVSSGPLNISAAQLTSIAMIILLSYINSKGLTAGKWIQNTFTTTKLLAITGFIIAGFLALNTEHWAANWSAPWHLLQHSSRTNTTNSDVWLMVSGAAAVGVIASAMVGSVFSSDAWNNSTFIAAEIKNPRRNVGLSLVFGTLIASVLYIAINVMYLAVMPLNELAFAPENRVAVSAAQVIFGQQGSQIIALIVMISTFGCNNGLILAGARVCYSMAKDGLFFRRVGQLNTSGVPAFALWIQCFVACVLCLSGKYADLLDYVSFVVMLFYILTIAGIFILRKKTPGADRPYKTVGYPILPGIYILLASIFCLALIIYKPVYTWPGLIIVLAGIPLYYMSSKNLKQT